MLFCIALLKKDNSIADIGYGLGFIVAVLTQYILPTPVLQGVGCAQKRALSLARNDTNWQDEKRVIVHSTERVSYGTK